jgi:DNA repair protein RadC
MFLLIDKLIKVELLTILREKFTKEKSIMEILLEIIDSFRELDFIIKPTH